MVSNLKLLKTVAYEFRMPLNTIDRIAHLLDNEDLDLSIKRKLHIINSCSEHLNNIIKDISNYYSNKESNHEKTEAISLYKLLTRTINSYSYNPNKNSIILDLKAPEILYEKKSILNQVINTVINNSITYTKNGLINVVVKTGAKKASSIMINISVKGSKNGNNQKLKEEIYPKVITDKSKSNNRLNVYLLLLKKIKKCNEQILELLTNTNSFSFDLKLKTSAGSLNFRNSYQTTQKKYTILVVEDNKLNQKLTKKIIERKGYNCDIADNGYQALKMVKQKKYNIILMDLIMPIMDGYEATKQLCKLKEKPLIIAFTAIAELEEINSLYDKGFNGILRKPFKINELYATINKLLIKSLE